MHAISRRQFLLNASVLTLSTGLVRPALAAAPHAEPSQLFDGKTFTGWEGNLGVFRIEDAAIVGGSLAAPVTRNEFLCTTNRYANFELTLNVRLLGNDANAGIQIRSERIPNDFEMIGYQADMGQQYWGCLYDESRRKKVLTGPKPEDIQKIVKQQDWNAYRIRCEGPRIRLWLNESQTVDYTESDETIPQDGHIALQIHGGPPSEAWYKNIEIRHL